MIPRSEEIPLIEEAMSKFPKEFGLKAFPDDRFRISESASYWTEGYDNEWGKSPACLMIYTQRLTEDGTWRDFAKGTISELHQQVTD